VEVEFLGIKVIENIRKKKSILIIKMWAKLCIAMKANFVACVVKML
jgi:hypothetical protein